MSSAFPSSYQYSDSGGENPSPSTTAGSGSNPVSSVANEPSPTIVSGLSNDSTSNTGGASSSGRPYAMPSYQDYTPNNDPNGNSSWQNAGTGLVNSINQTISSGFQAANGYNAQYSQMLNNSQSAGGGPTSWGGPNSLYHNGGDDPENPCNKRNQLFAVLAALFLFLLMLVSPNKNLQNYEGGGKTSSTSTSPSTASEAADENTESLTTLITEKVNEASNGVAGEDHSSNTPISTIPSGDTTTTAAENNDVKIAYFITYPMSGTTFTTRLIQDITNTTTATNYAFDGHKDSNGHIIPIYPSHNPNYHDNDEQPPLPATPYTAIPFWSPHYLFPFDPASYHRLTHHPTKYVPTLSHCTGFCDYPCPPAQYVQTIATFDEACRTIHASSSDNNLPSEQWVVKPNEQDYTTYITDRKYISNKVIHLVRDPYSNIVSRFHAARRSTEKSQGTAASLPNTPEGFQKWCAQMDDDASLNAKEQSSTFLSREVTQGLFPNIPCHSEFYKYFQWHNLAIQWSTIYHHKESLIVHYEDYNTEGKRAKVSLDITTFLEQEFVDLKRIPFDLLDIVGKEYNGAEWGFDGKVKGHVKDLARVMVGEDETAWSLFKRYFEE